MQTTDSGLVLPPSHVEPVYDLQSAFEQVLMDALGMPRGTNTEGDVLTQTIDGRSLNDIWTEFQASLGMWNQARSTLVQALTFPVTQPIEEVPQITGDDFEEASEFGEPKGIQGGDFFSLGYDFKWYDLAIRYTWKYLAEATAQQVESLNNMALEADNRLVFSRVMRAIFNSSNRTADIRGNAVTVYPFYNADGTVPPRWKNNVHDGTHNHYITSGAATIDSGDLDTLEEHLVHHGYGKQNGSTMVILANRQEIATMRSFRVLNGDSYDFIPGVPANPFLMPDTTTVAGSSPPSNWNGLTVAGQYGPFFVIEEDYVPAGYVVALATGGQNQATNPVGFRQHQNAGLQGLRLVKGRDNDYPLIDSFYNRGFGTGIRHRGAGVVMQITANADYAEPSDYA